MSPCKNPVIRLLHIKDEIDALLQAFSSVEKEQFATNYILVRATERAILIISEAAKALPDELISGYSEIDWPAIKAIGNILRHEYERVEPLILWNIVSDNLPVLNTVVTRMIDGLDHENRSRR